MVLLGRNPYLEQDLVIFNSQEILEVIKMTDVRREIRTPAHRSGLRPKRSALDHSAILTLHTFVQDDFFKRKDTLSTW